VREQCVTNGKIVSLVLRNSSRCAADKTWSRFLRDGRERLHELFGRLKAEKVGSLPPNLVFFSVSLFSFSCRLFPCFPKTYAHPKLKKMVKTKLKDVIPTFFTCFAQIPAARTERIFMHPSPSSVANTDRGSLKYSSPTLVRGPENGKAQ